MEDLTERLRGKWIEDKIARTREERVVRYITRQTATLSQTTNSAGTGTWLGSQPETVFRQDCRLRVKAASRRGAESRFSRRGAESEARKTSVRHGAGATALCGFMSRRERKSRDMSRELSIADMKTSCDAVPSDGVTWQRRGSRVSVENGFTKGFSR